MCALLAISSAVSVFVCLFLELPFLFLILFLEFLFFLSFLPFAAFCHSRQVFSIGEEVFLSSEFG